MPTEAAATDERQHQPRMIALTYSARCAGARPRARLEVRSSVFVTSICARSYVINFLPKALAVSPQ